MKTQYALHRRILPSDPQTELNRVRHFPSKKGRSGKVSFDVHSHNDSNSQLYVNKPGKDDNVIGGISAWICDHPYEHDTSFIIDSEVEDGYKDKSLFLSRENDDGILVQKRRFFCYRLPVETDIALGIDVDARSTNNSLHVTLYPTEKTTLDKPRTSAKGKPGTGDLMKIEASNWEFCCIMIQCEELETYKWLKGRGKDPDFKKHEDEECAAISCIIEDFLKDEEIRDVEMIDNAWNTLRCISGIQNLSYIKVWPISRIKLLSTILENVNIKSHPDDSTNIFRLNVKVIKLLNDAMKMKSDQGNID